ncbi:MAG: hypothetical protein DCC75_05440 [Proteobacteria bacterium]|nr:MAG: hypothetical protein DCC75_05440 [Pseudomonadota bacterium]
MFRYLFGFLSTIIIARWIYAEIQLSLPSVVPVINFVLEKAQIPTHDTWELSKLNELLSERGGSGAKVYEARSREDRGYTGLRSYNDE